VYNLVIPLKAMGFMLFHSWDIFVYCQEVSDDAELDFMPTYRK